MKLETTLSQHHASEWVDLIGTDVGQHTGGFGLVADQVAKVRRKFEKAKPGVGEQLVEKMEAWEANPGVGVPLAMEPPPGRSFRFGHPSMVQPETHLPAIW